MPDEVPHHLSRQIYQVACYLVAVLENQEKIMATLADIQAAVAAETDVEQAAITLLEKLHTDLQAALNAGDQGAMQAVLDQLASNKAALAAAVATNAEQPSVASSPPAGSAPPA